MKKYLILLLLVSGVSISFSAHAALTIGVDNSASSSALTSATTCNFSITVTSTQSNLILVVGVGNLKASGSVTSTQIKANGTNMTFLLSKLQSSGANMIDDEIWYELNPPAGVVSVTTTWSGAPNVSGCGGVSLYNVNQSTPIDATSTNGSVSGSTPNTTITTNVANDALIDKIYSINVPNPTSGNIQEWLISAGNNRQAMSYQTTTIPNSYTISWGGSTGPWASNLIALEPAPSSTSGATNANFNTMNGGIFSCSNSTFRVSNSELQIQ